jgi:hypothetical protein
VGEQKSTGRMSSMIVTKSQKASSSGKKNKIIPTMNVMFWQYLQNESGCDKEMKRESESEREVEKKKERERIE